MTILVPVTLQASDALLIVDVQNDFLPGGRLAIPGGDAVVPVLNEYVHLMQASRGYVFATRDWHPAHHCSFRERGGPWPAHCVQGTHGAEFARGLRLPGHALLVSKGGDPERDALSGFDGTRLEESLRAIGVGRLLVGGLATDVCVLQTVRDARSHGHDVLLLDDAIRGIDPARSHEAREEMVALGATPITLQSIAPRRSVDRGGG